MERPNDAINNRATLLDPNDLPEKELNVKQTMLGIAQSQKTIENVMSQHRRFILKHKSEAKLTSSTAMPNIALSSKSKPFIMSRRQTLC